ncbi:hypothetical protein [Yoonia sp. 208BN28-4]|uniref:hypothetical protein n=1 Tax=Yoonia sp. 208BN28-4 TaxID=3126505 RepID=UPI0030B02A09
MAVQAGHRYRTLLCLPLVCVVALSGCQRPLPEPVPVSLLPLTVEQALPAGVPAAAVYERGGCYFYRSPDRFVQIETVAAPDAPQPNC